MASCSSSRLNIEKEGSGLNTMIDYYYYHFGDFPSSLDALEVFSNLHLYDSSFIDTAKITICNLKKNKNTIAWQLDDTFPQNHLLITQNKDTLAFRINENRFPSLDDFIYSYTDCYGVFPSNACDLIAFRKAALKVTKFMQFWEYDSLTVQNLQKCLDLGILSWSVSEKGLIIKVHDDTLSNWSSNNQRNAFCYKTPEDAFYFSPRFFDSDNIYVFCDNDLYNDFRHHIRELYHLMNESNEAVGCWHFLIYTKERGLESLCENVDISTNNTWEAKVVEYVGSFAEENNFSKIIFSCPSLR